MPNMSWRLVDGRFFLLFHNAKPPEDSVWNAYLAEFSKHAGNLAGVRTLVITQGGSPSTEQRSKLNQIMQYKSTPTVVVSDVVMVRTVVRMLNVFNSLIRVYAPDKLGDAFRYLGVDPSKQADFFKALEEMRTAVNSDMTLAA